MGGWVGGREGGEGGRGGRIDSEIESVSNPKT